MSLAPSPTLAPSGLADMFRRIRAGGPSLWWSNLALIFGLVICCVLMFFDARTFNGINVWDKPAKFFLSLAVQGATLAFALSFLPQDKRKATDIRYALAAAITSSWLEVLYIVFRASRAEASHFNSDSVLGQVAYSMMGAGALLLTFSSFYIGFRVWGQRRQGLMAEATSLGVMVGMVLGTLAGMTLGAHGGHWVGGTLNDAHGLGLLSWSTTGGDLRVAHFVGLHAAQGVPLVALSGSRALVYAVALLFVLATAFTLVQALLGIPLLRA